MPGARVLTQRQLNRTLLQRQLLLARSELSVVDAVRQVGGLQAQDARPPYVSLWSRLGGFSEPDLTEALTSRRLVRATAMRGTLFVVDVESYLDVRPAIREIADRGMRLVGPDPETVDVDRILATARDLLHEQPRTMTALRKALGAAFPDVDDRRVLWAARYLLPLVVVPQPMRWGFPFHPPYALAEDWLGRRVPSRAAVDRVILRYLAALGPATVADVHAWSGLQAMRAHVDRLRPHLRTYEDEHGRELLDVEGGAIADPDQPAPVRFLSAFDNAVLSHADRSRVIDEDARRVVFASKNGRWEQTYLVDGRVAGTWSLERTTHSATLTTTPFGRVTASSRRDLEDEANALVRFLEPDSARHDVVVTD